MYPLTAWPIRCLLFVVLSAHVSYEAWHGMYQKEGSVNSYWSHQYQSWNSDWNIWLNSASNTLGGPYLVSPIFYFIWTWRYWYIHCCQIEHHCCSTRWYTIIYSAILHLLHQYRYHYWVVLFIITSYKYQKPLKRRTENYSNKTKSCQNNMFYANMHKPNKTFQIQVSSLNKLYMYLNCNYHEILMTCIITTVKQ